MCFSFTLSGRNATRLTYSESHFKTTAELCVSRVASAPLYIFLDLNRNASYCCQRQQGQDIKLRTSLERSREPPSSVLLSSGLTAGPLTAAIKGFPAAERPLQRSSRYRQLLADSASMVAISLMSAPARFSPILLALN